MKNTPFLPITCYTKNNTPKNNFDIASMWKIVSPSLIKKKSHYCNERKSLLSFVIQILLTATICVSCQKTIVHDVIKQPTGSKIENTFFTLHRGSDPIESSLVEFVKRKNIKKHFVEETVKRIGYPRWDKVLSMSNKVLATIKTNSTLRSNSTQIGNEIYYIPFVRSNENFVNATMVIVASSTDTSISYVMDWQHTNKVNSSSVVETSAERHALFFMMLDYRTFGHTQFTILDKNLFKEKLPSKESNKRVGIVVKNKPTSTNENRVTDLLNIVCIDYYVCGTPNYCGSSCDYLINCGFCHLLAAPICGWTQDTGGNPTWLGFTGNTNNFGNEGGGSWGGGGNNGSDLPPVPCDVPPSQAAIRSQNGQIKVNNNCPSTGWTPIVVFNSNTPFDYLHLPIDGPDELIINNGVEISDNIDLGTNYPPRLIARSLPRGNTEDMQYGTNGDISNILYYLQHQNDQDLFDNMKSLFDMCTVFDNDLQNIGNDMMLKFKNRTGGQYTNQLLNSKVSQSSAIFNYLKRFGEVLNTQLRATGGNINNISTINLPFRPVFNNLYNKFHGLQILINDTESTDIELNNFTIDNLGNWSADVTITIRDHFGLDKHDALAYQAWHEGFPSWWLLQHTRNYKPFETVVVVKKKISSRL